MQRIEYARPLTTGAPEAWPPNAGTTPVHDEGDAPGPGTTAVGAGADEADLRRAGRHPSPWARARPAATSAGTPWASGGGPRSMVASPHARGSVSRRSSGADRVSSPRVAPRVFDHDAHRARNVARKLAQRTTT
ncbi:hypothetical protein E3O19_14150 [Cryobacterium algoritolerans]|uniref:Uncharacterized protein n=1 Tax=Cryobacterium algoritolerans TaxID=1259184 RepID=A0A4R8WMQ6_9MICO|nr:hypothetical protein [Cryobacterium algoritolerans]TFC11395.1 hypothetical protein E3O19_14150 [Cryobacterium algoritolerans]